MRESPARELQLAALASVLLATISWFPAIRRLDATGFGDWQLIHHNWEAAYVSLARFHEWPLWDPFHCGGIAVLENPESQVYAPWFWLSFLFGTVIAIKLMLLGHNAIALTGMYWLARRRYQLQAPSAALAAVGWACSGCFTWDGAGGHATFMPFAFAPWLSYFVARRTWEARELAWVTALLVLTLFEGGTYPLPYFVVWLAVEFTLRVISERTQLKRSLLGSLRFAGLAGGLLALCGAIRFVPIYLALAEHPRTVPNDDSLHIIELWGMLTSRTHAWTMPGHPFVWPEYGSYMGVPVTVLATVGLVFAARSGRRHWLACLLLYGSLMFGNWSVYAPFSLLHHLPIYDSLRVPSRFAIFFTFYLALLAACALDAAVCAIPRRVLGASLAWLFVSAVFIDLVVVAAPIAGLWREPPIVRAPVAREFHLVRRDYYRYNASFPGLNVGTSTCYPGGMNWPVSRALWLGAQPQLRLDPGHGRILSWRSTPHTLHAQLELNTPTRVVFNQNFARGYSASSGPVLDDQGLVAVDVPAGKQRLELRYRPAEFVPSAAVSCCGLALLAMLFMRRPTRTARQPRRAAADAESPKS